MASVALQQWETERAVRLDEILNAHRSVGGTGPGRRYATLQINQAYAVLLASHFQGFCRDLHSECVDFLAGAVAPASLRLPLRNEFSLNRKLDRGNPNPGNIGSDFGRLGLTFWPLVEAIDPSVLRYKVLLGELNDWRNAIAHQDFDPTKLGGTTTLRLARVREWRRACDELASSFDIVMRNYLLSIVGSAPW